MACGGPYPFVISNAGDPFTFQICAVCHPPLPLQCASPLHSHVYTKGNAHRFLKTGSAVNPDSTQNKLPVKTDVVSSSITLNVLFQR